MSPRSGERSYSNPKRRQQAINEELERLVPLNNNAGQPESIALLADEQNMLRADILSEAEELVSLPVFVYQLKNVAGQMQRVSEDLLQQQISESTEQTARDILTELRRLADAVKKERQDLAASKPPSSSGSGGQGQGGTNPTAAQTLQLMLGQLRLLKSLQTALQKDTRQLEADLADGLQPDQILLDRAKALATRQQQLRELAEQLQPESTCCTFLRKYLGW